MISAKVFVHSLLLICLIGIDMVAAQGLSNLLSRLYKNAAQNNKPLVLIIDKSNVREEQESSVKPTNLVKTSSEAEEETEPAVYLIQSQVPRSSPPPPTPPSPLPPPPQKRLPPVRGLGASGGGLSVLGSLDGLGLIEVPVHRPRSKHHPRFHPIRIVGRTTPSPIMKILRQSECDATESCINQCNNRLAGKKKTTCKAQCEVTYECTPTADRDEDYEDPCEDEENDCGKHPSTRGIRLVTPEKPPCTRC